MRKRTTAKHPNDPYGAFLSKNRERFPQAWKTYLAEELRIRRFHQYQRPVGPLGKGALS